MRIDTAIKRLTENFNKAKNLGWVEKPISYALYQTWKWANTYEKPRKVKENG